MTKVPSRGKCGTIVLLFPLESAVSVCRTACYISIFNDRTNCPVNYIPGLQNYIKSKIQN